MKEINSKYFTNDPELKDNISTLKKILRVNNEIKH